MSSLVNHDVKGQIAEDERTTKQFSSEKALELLFNNNFYLSGGCSSDSAVNVSLT